ncbi:MAG: leucine-rich repeat domain-containing protein [Chromatiales bacterium]
MPAFTASSTVYDLLTINGGTTLATVQRGAFNGMKVKEISLWSIGVTTIQSGAFHDVGDLVKLSLYNNQMETIPDDAFNGLKQLKTLCLCSNPLKTVNASWCSQMPALEMLQLQNNQLETIQDGAFNGLNQLNT